MRLNYEIARELASREEHEKGSDTLVIRLDAHQVASLVADGKPNRLASDERLLQVHQSERRWQIGPDAYFFEEGAGGAVPSGPLRRVPATSGWQDPAGGTTG